MHTRYKSLTDALQIFFRFPYVCFQHCAASCGVNALELSCAALAALSWASDVAHRVWARAKYFKLMNKVRVLFT